MSDAKAAEAVAEYYKMKGQYEGSYERRKKKIMRQRIPLSEKRAKIAALQRKCPGCKGTNGMQFTAKGALLKVTCPTLTGSCALDIQVDRGRYGQISDLLSGLSIKLEQEKMTIVRLKLDLLFGLKHEAAVMAEFEQLKNQYKATAAAVAKAAKLSAALRTVTVEDIGGERTLEWRDLVALQERDISRLVRNIRILMQDYQQTEDLARRQGYLDEAVEVYVGQIRPALDRARADDYAVSTVIEEHGKFRLIQMRNTEVQREVVLSPPKMMSNKK